MALKSQIFQTLSLIQAYIGYQASLPKLCVNPYRLNLTIRKISHCLTEL